MNINFIFIKTQILFLSKNQLHIYRKSNFISIKNQILFLSKIKIYLYKKSNFIFVKILFDFCH